MKTINIRGICSFSASYAHYRVIAKVAKSKGYDSVDDFFTLEHEVYQTYLQTPEVIAEWAVESVISKHLYLELVDAKLRVSDLLDGVVARNLIQWDSRD